MSSCADFYVCPICYDWLLRLRRKLDRERNGTQQDIRAYTTGSSPRGGAASRGGGGGGSSRGGSNQEAEWSSQRQSQDGDDEFDEGADGDDGDRKLGHADEDDPMAVLTCSEYGDKGAAQILFRSKAMLERHLQNTHRVESRFKPTKQCSEFYKRQKLRESDGILQRWLAVDRPDVTRRR
jgi:hypothetical protein